MKARHKFSHLEIALVSLRNILSKIYFNFQNNFNILGNLFSHMKKILHNFSHAYLKSAMEMVLKAFKAVRALSIVLSFIKKLSKLKFSELKFSTLMVIN